MMFMKKKAGKAAAQREKVTELQVQREMVKKNIRLLRTDMQSLIDQAAGADDLDRKILSLEYDEKKAELNAETVHFNELSKLISQLNGVAMVYKRQKIFDQVATVADDIDTQALLEAEDMMTARRTMMQEESDALDDVLRGSSVRTEELGESAEFTRLVRDAQLKKASAARNVAQEEPAAAQVVCG